MLSRQHLEVLTVLAVFTAVGIQQARLREKVQREQQSRCAAGLPIEELLGIAKSFSSDLEITSLIQKITTKARDLLDAEGCSLFLRDRRADELWTIVADGTQEIRFPMTLGIAGHVAETGEVLNISDVSTDARFDPKIDQPAGLQTKSILCLPLFEDENTIISVIQILNKVDGPFVDQDEELMNAFSALAAVAIRNALLFQRTLERRDD